MQYKRLNNTAGFRALAVALLNAGGSILGRGYGQEAVAVVNAGLARPFMGGRSGDPKPYRVPARVTCGHRFGSKPPQNGAKERQRRLNQIAHHGLLFFTQYGASPVKYPGVRLTKRAERYGLYELERDYE